MAKEYRPMGLVLILASVLLTAAAACAKESIDFSGKLLIGLRTKPAQAPARGELRAGAWRLTPIFDTAEPRRAALEADAATAPGHYWLVATPPLAGAVGEPPTDLRPWDIAHRTLDGTAPAPYATLLEDLAVRLDERVVPSVVEPDIIYTDRRVPKATLQEAAAECQATCRSDPERDDLKLCSEPSVHWPSGEFAWHQHTDKSQLRDARENVQGALNDSPPRVFVVHVDTGYSGGDALLPPHFDEENSLDFTLGDEHQPGGTDPCHDGLLNQPGHGTKTLSVLAGNRGKVLADDGSLVFHDFVGGAPRARVASYRVSDSVIHFYPKNLAYAIDTAAERGADVVSISMGGLPSWTLRDAVNDAYEQGTAVVAAAGNSYKTPIPWISSPASTVYPARFSRVVAVTGVTGDDRSYAKAPSLWSLLRGNCSSWMLRGNYGPAWVMGEAIAAYTPNISWSRIGNQNPSRLADRNGSGTSAATPQVAAAAALWLDKHRDGFADNDSWRSWKKTEAVYQALFDSAKKDVPDPDYAKIYFGQGILQAFEALGKEVRTDLSKRPRAEIHFAWVAEALELGPPLEVMPEEAAAHAAREQAHYRMIQLEMAQLLYGSKRLEDILGDADPEALRDDPEELRRFLEAVREDERVSDYLRKVLIFNGY